MKAWTSISASFGLTWPVDAFSGRSEDQQHLWRPDQEETSQEDLSFCRVELGQRWWKDLVEQNMNVSPSIHMWICDSPCAVTDENSDSESELEDRARGNPGRRAQLSSRSHVINDHRLSWCLQLIAGDSCQSGLCWVSRVRPGSSATAPTPGASLWNRSSTSVSSLNTSSWFRCRGQRPGAIICQRSRSSSPQRSEDSRVSSFNWAASTDSQVYETLSGRQEVILYSRKQ